MEFFNFTNESTYHLFQWLVHSGQVDINALVHNTLAEAKTDPLVEMDLATSVLARENLQQQLRHLFRQHRQTWFAKNELDLDRYSAEACGAASNDYAEPDALFLARPGSGCVQHLIFGRRRSPLTPGRKWAPNLE